MDDFVLGSPVGQAKDFLDIFSGSAFFGGSDGDFQGRKNGRIYFGLFL